MKIYEAWTKEIPDIFTQTRSHSAELMSSVNFLINLILHPFSDWKFCASGSLSAKVL